MIYKYIVVLNRGHHPADKEIAPSETLEALGMDCRLSLGHARVFVSKDTPTALISEKAIVIGHLFAKTTQDDASRTPVFAERHANLNRHLLDNFWGEYVAISLPPDNPDALNILRDPSGGTPCVYSLQGGEGFITSDISIAEQLDLFTRRVDWDFISHALTFTYLRTGRTGLSGISELLPGCSLSIRQNSTTTEMAWSPWNFVAVEYRHSDPDDAATRIRDAVTSVVNAWARTDGTMLLELSGGLDSSIVAACLRDTDARVVCCTLMPSVPGTDERPYARKMADMLGVELQSLNIDLASARYDFPPPTDSVVPGMGVFHYAVDEALSAAAQAHHVNSFASGAGGDTVFCYLKGAAPAADAFKEQGVAAGIAAIGNLSALHQCSFSKAARLTLKKLIRGARAPRPANTAFLNPSMAAVTPGNHPWFDVPSGVLPGDQEKVFDLVGSQSFIDGMARNRRWPMRFPLLSQPVIEECLRVPTWMWISDGWNRSVARRAFAQVLPKDVLYRKSKGTYMNYSGAMYARYKHGMLNFLETGHMQSRGLLDVAALQKFVRSDTPPKNQSFVRIFELCMIENWIRHQCAAEARPSAGMRTPDRPALIARQRLY